MELSPEDYKKYSELLSADHDLTDKQVKEYIDQAWLITNCFVDLAFEQSPEQLVLKGNKDRADLREAISKVIEKDK